MLARDGYRCRLQLAGVCTTVATQAHHVLGRAVTGDDPAYCVASCQPCNVAMGDPVEHGDPDPVRPTSW